MLKIKEHTGRPQRSTNDAAVKPRIASHRRRTHGRRNKKDQKEAANVSQDGTKGKLPLCHNKWTENIREPVMSIMDVSCCRELSRKKMNEEGRSSVGSKVGLMSPVIASLP